MLMNPFDTGSDHEEIQAAPPMGGDRVTPTENPFSATAIAVPSPWPTKPSPIATPAPAPTTPPPAPAGPTPIATGPGGGGAGLTPDFDYRSIWEQTGRSPASYVREVISRLRLTGRQSDPNATGIKEIIKALQAVGVNAQMPAQPSSGGMNKGIVIDGVFIKLLDGYDRWMWSEGDNLHDPAPPGTTVPGLPIGPGPGAQFDDPTTRYLEDFLKGRLDELNAPVHDEARDQLAKLLDEQISRYGGFLSDQEGTNETLRARQGAANASADEYIAYLKSHADELQRMPPEIQQAYEQLVAGTNQRMTDLKQLPPELAAQLDQYRTGTSTRIEDLRNIPPEYQRALNDYLETTGVRAQELGGLPQPLQDALAELESGTTSRRADLSHLPPELQAALAELESGTGAHRADLSRLPPDLQAALADLESGTTTRRGELSHVPPDLQAALADLESGTAARRSDLSQLPPELAAALQDLVSQTQGRMSSLRDPAYTGTEQEILRTQALDPIEADRQAAKQRDIARIGNQGILPSSGIALALQHLTDQSYDKQRNTAQGELAYKQIQERRERDAEIQRLSESLFGTRAGVSAIGEGRKAESQGLLESLFTTRAGVSAVGESRKAESQGLLESLFGTRAGVSAVGEDRKQRAQDLLESLFGTKAGVSAVGEDRKAESQGLLESLFGTRAGVSAVDEERQTQAQSLRDQMFGARQEGVLFGEDRRDQAQSLLDALTQTEVGAAQYQDSRRGEAQSLQQMLADAATNKSQLETQRRTAAGDMLGSIPGIQREGIESDVALNNEMQAALERITQGQIAVSGQRAGLNEQVRSDEATRRQEALALASLLQQLPTAAMQQAMAAIGQAPNPESMISQLINLFGIGQTTRNQNAEYYTQLGQSLPYLVSAFAPRRGAGASGGAGAPGLPGGGTGPF